MGRLAAARGDRSRDCIPASAVVHGQRLAARAGHAASAHTGARTDPLSTTSYERAFDLVDLARYTVNSLVVATLTVPLAVLVASWAGFAFLLVGGRARSVLIGLSFAALMVP